MKVKATRSFAGISFSAKPGAVIDVPEAVAEDLIRAGYAESESQEKEPTPRKSRK